MGSIESQLQELKDLIKENNLLNKEVLNVNEAAWYLDVSKPTLYKLTSEHKIPFYKPTLGKLYFKREELKSYMLSNRQSTEQELSDNAVHFLTQRRRTA